MRNWFRQWQDTDSVTEPPRALERDDVRVNWHGQPVTAPPWAFRADPWGCPKPIPEVWQPLLALLQEQADANHQRELAQRAAFVNAALASPEGSPLRAGLAFLIQDGPPERVIVHAPCHFRKDSLRWCRHCPKFFLGDCRARYCSEACLRAVKARKAARRNRKAAAARAVARRAARGGRVCPVCGVPLEAKRSTARYCSARCRVAWHRRQK